MKAPRAADTYRGARRNAAKALRQLPEWRGTAANRANIAAKLGERAALVHAAVKAGTKALVGNRHGRPDIVFASALLDFYHAKGGGGRAMHRIVRQLENSIRVAA